MTDVPPTTATSSTATAARKPATRREAMRAVQRLWVAGTLGAFFAALARFLPIHIAQHHWPPDWNYTLDLVARYGYLLWLLSYFFVSNLVNEVPDAPATWRDVWFDVAQSATSLIAAYFLGFVDKDIHFERGAYIAANGAILAITLLALAMFHDDRTRGINPIRIVGAAISAVGLAVALCASTLALCVLGTMLVLVVLLFGLLVGYMAIRVNWKDA